MDVLKTLGTRLLNGWQLSRLSTFEVAARHESFALAADELALTPGAERVQEAARILELDGLLKRRPRELSGGQRQRVAMGRAIVRDPAVFLFDEPLSNLDAKLRVQMRLELQQLHRRLKTTSLYVTHDQVEAMTLAQRVMVMNKGGARRRPRGWGLSSSRGRRLTRLARATGSCSFVARTGAQRRLRGIVL